MLHAAGMNEDSAESPRKREALEILKEGNVLVTKDTRDARVLGNLQLQVQ